MGNAEVKIMNIELTRTSDSLNALNQSTKEHSKQAARQELNEDQHQCINGVCLVTWKPQKNGKAA